MKNSTLRVKTETFVERANSWQEYYDIGHQLGEMGGLIRRMAMHMVDLQKKVDRQAAELKRQNIGWIPCSERLPEELVPVNITWVNRNPPFYYRDIKDKPFTATAVFYKGIWHWWSEIVEDVLAEYGHHIPSEIDKYIDIIAWMPLPEPYKESEEK